MVKVKLSLLSQSTYLRKSGASGSARIIEVVALRAAKAG